MGSSEQTKPHAVFLPYPAQGHITPMLNLAKLLHSHAFHITFVNTHFNHQRLLQSRGPDSLKGLQDFHFESIPDGLPPSDYNGTQDIEALCRSTQTFCAVPFRNLVVNLNSSCGVPPVSCIVADGMMGFSVGVAEELGIPLLQFWTMSACGFMGYLHLQELINRGYVPLPDESCITNGYLDKPIEWIPGMKDIRLKDLPSFIRTTHLSDFMLNFEMEEASKAIKSHAIILNTWDSFEQDVIDAIGFMFPRLYTIGPLHRLIQQTPESDPTNSIQSNLWKEDTQCLKWLDQRQPGSVIYVNYGSITVLTPDQLKEFAWGLANSNHPFLWVVRSDLVRGDSAVLSEEFMKERKDRYLIVSWCPQEQVLAHPSVGGFLTHSGWNSTLESVCNGVPLICWPFFAEQQMNCRYACRHWGIGTEIEGKVSRVQVEMIVRELMEGDKGKEMRKRAMEWKESAQAAAEEGGSSYRNLERMVNDLCFRK